MKPKVRNDPQNTHDSLVVSTIKASLNSLESCTPIKKDTTKSLKEIRDLIETTAELPKEKAVDAIKVLDRIERNYEPHTTFGKTESDILNLVYNRIETFPKEQQESLKKHLLEELADAVEYDRVVCSSGRASRMVDTLNFIDPKVQIKPTWCLSKELIDATGAMRNKHYNQLTAYEKECVDTINPTPEQSRVYDEFVEGIKRDIKGKFHTDYVKPGLVTEKKLNLELQKWIDAAF